MKLIVITHFLEAITSSDYADLIERCSGKIPKKILK